MDESLREFFYVDVERARSYLAQLDRGVVQSVIERSSGELSAEAKASMFGFGGSGSVSRGTGREEARSLQDLTFVAFESLALQQGFLVDSPPEVSDPDAWTTGTIQNSFLPGQIVRLKADVQILDPRFFEARIQRVDAFANALVRVTTPIPAVKPGTPRQQQKKAADAAHGAARAELWGDTSPDAVQGIADVVSSLLGDAIAVRVLPCGRDHPDLGFGGALIDRREYVQPEREALFSRYGPVLSDWTCVIQIASIPSQSEEIPDVLPAIELMGKGNRIQRAAVEQLAVQFLTLMESIGMAEGPRWPSISVTPLAIYRHLPSIR